MLKVILCLHYQAHLSGKTLDFDFGTAYADAELKIIATVNRSVASSKTKTLNVVLKFQLQVKQKLNQVLLV